MTNNNDYRSENDGSAFNGGSSPLRRDDANEGFHSEDENQYYNNGGDWDAVTTPDGNAHNYQNAMCNNNDYTSQNVFDNTQTMSPEHLHTYQSHQNHEAMDDGREYSNSFDNYENHNGGGNTPQNNVNPNNSGGRESSEYYWAQSPNSSPQSTPSNSFGYPTNGGVNEYSQNSTGRKKSWGSGLIGVAMASAIIGGLLGGGISYAANHGINTSETITKQSITQNVTGGVNWNATATTASQSVVTILVKGASGSGEGSGVIYSKDGYIITNNHVSSVAGSDGQLQVSMGNKVYNAKVVGADEASDLAVLKISSKTELTPIKFADSSKVTVGDQVMAVGSPLGLTDTATTGIISALNRPVITRSENSENYVITNALQTSAPINPGNSGGALVNKNGELVGINSSIATLSNGGTASNSSSGSIGIGFSIPSNSVKNTVEQILKDGKAKHALLGITPEATIVGDANSGILGIKIKSLSGGDSAAGKAGLNAGDVITQFNGHNTTTEEELIASVREMNPGDKVKIKYYKNGSGSEKTVEVTLTSASE